MAINPQIGTIRKLFGKGQALSFTKGDIVLGNSDSPDGVYFISTGYVKVYSIGNDGTEYVHIIYGAGELFPLNWAYLDIAPDDLYFTAISDTVLWRMSKYWFNKFVATRLDISYAMSLQLAQQFHTFAKRVDNLEYKKAEERVAYRVLFLASRFGVKDNGVITIDPPITHEIFANSINLARESVSREIEKLERQGIISREDHRIIIKDPDALIRITGTPIRLQDWRV